MKKSILAGFLILALTVSLMPDGMTDGRISVHSQPYAQGFSGEQNFELWKEQGVQKRDDTDMQVLAEYEAQAAGGQAGLLTVASLRADLAPESLWAQAYSFSIAGNIEEVLDLLQALPSAEEIGSYTEEERDALRLRVQAAVDAVQEIPEGEQEAFYGRAETEGLLEKLFELSVALDEESTIMPLATRTVQVGALVYKIFYGNEPGRENYTAIVANHATNRNVAGNITIPATISVSGTGSGIYNVVGIEDSAFKDNYGISGITFPNSSDFTAIGNQAFFGCTRLQGNLNLPDSLVSIGAFAFYNCSGLTGDLRIPDGVTELGDNIFNNCTGFNGKLTLPSSLKQIGGSTFNNCPGLQGPLVLPPTLTVIGAYAFYDCSGLNGTLVLPLSLMRIGEYAFRGCAGLTGELNVPDTLTYIGGMAFMGTNFSRVNHVKFITLDAKLKNLSETEKPDYDEGGYEDSTLLLDNAESFLFKAAKWTDDSLTEAEIRIDHARGVHGEMDILFVLDYSNSMLGVDAIGEGYVYPRSFVLDDLVLEAIECLLEQNAENGYDLRVGMTSFGSPGYRWGVDFSGDIHHLQEKLRDNPLLQRNVTSYTDGLQQAIEMIEARGDSDRPCKIVFVSDGFPSDANGVSGVAPGQAGIFDGSAEAQKLRSMGVDVIPLAIYMPTTLSDEMKARAAAFFRNISFDSNTYFTASDSFEFQEVWSHIITQELFTVDTVVTDTLSKYFMFRTGVAEADITASAGVATLDESTGVVTWNLNGTTGWEVHTLIIQVRLKPDALQSIGSLPTNLRLTSSAEKINAGPDDKPSGSPYLVRYLVEHNFISGTPKRELPEEIRIGLLPPFKGGFRNGVDVVPTLTYKDTVFEQGTEFLAGEDTWIFTEWDKQNDVISNANVIFTGVWKVQGADTSEPALIRVQKVVEDGGDSDDIFLIHLKEKDQILGSVALQHNEVGGWMSLDMESQPYRTITISELVPMAYTPYYSVQIQKEDGDRDMVQERTITVYPGDSLTVIITNSFTHTGFFKDKSWVRNVFAASGNP